jgi:hypothetical protein
MGEGEEVAVWRRRCTRRSIPDRADDLVRECEALLGGDYLTFLDHQDRWTPSWALVNALAHSGPQELARWAAGDVPEELAGMDPAAGWRRLVVFLAEEILSRASAAGVTLDELQRSTLIPLELDLLRGARPEPDTGRLATMVMAAVRH